MGDVLNRLESRLSSPARTGITRLALIHGAILTPTLACLFSRPPLSRLLRLVWLDGAAGRLVVAEALRQAGVKVIEQPTTPGSTRCGPTLLTRRAPWEEAAQARGR
jgi:hypothetical protein